MKQKTDRKNIYSTGLDKCAANYSALTPLNFLERAATVYPENISLIYDGLEYTWFETYQRARKLSSALIQRGIGIGDTVSVIAANIPPLYEAHFGVPMCGAVLNALNTRLDAQTIAFILEHAETKILLTDTGYSDVIKEALSLTKAKPVVIDICDPAVNNGERLGSIDYESFLGQGDADYNWSLPEDEWQAISLNYTSGTTGNPKGVVYHHRGAYLDAMCNIIEWEMGHHPVYLWTLPMFHCNGWCFPWAMAAIAGANICLRQVSAKAIYEAIDKHQVSHFCGAPIILNFIINAKVEEIKNFQHTVNVMTAGAPPPSAVIQAMEEAGFNVTHVYGLTETYGPAVICAWKKAWDDLPANKQAQFKSRQGVKYPALTDLQVIDPESMQPVPADGETMGEVMFRGNIIMKGYLKNPFTTADAFQHGWFHSGDLGVMHPDGYIQIKDRSKDIIISGGENISSIEIEDVLYKHPAILEAAVVAREDDKWGESPCAFIKLKNITEDLSDIEIMDFCKNHLASFKIPRTIVFTNLPKTSTGKIQKFKLRDEIKKMGSLTDPDKQL